MKQIQRLSSILSALAVTMVLAGAAPAAANGGGTDDAAATAPTSTPTATEPEHSGSTSGSTSGSSTEHSDKAVPRPRSIERKDAKQSTGDQQEVHANAENDSESKAELHKKGENLVASMKKEHGGKEKDDTKRTKTCESNKQGLQQKFTSIVANSQRVQTRISNVFDKAVAYQQTSGASSDSLTSLAAAAQTAKVASGSSITALQSVNVSVDCNNKTVATDVAAFKVAAQDTRTSLHSYRSAVKAYLQALETAVSVEKTTTEGATN